ncbi:MAG: complex I NDUFA9 subunit family protein [Rickettsiales bacterium]|nr:complex I NDUFA9 subunit family protein [Rickettsiales bacterium]
MNKLITIFGGTGFVGKNLINNLIKQGFTVQIISRDISKAKSLTTFAGPDFLKIAKWNYQLPKEYNLKENYKTPEELKNEDIIKKIIKGSYAVVNLVGILYENKKGDFYKFHHNLAGYLARISQEVGVKKFIHLSALGIDIKNNSKYCDSKLKGESAVLSQFPDATILRPSIIFGQNDNFFNRFANDFRKAPIAPIINHGKTKFQPIFVEDLIKIITKSINCEDIKNKINGKIFEISGPKIYDFKQLMTITAKYLNKKIYFININFRTAFLLAWLLEFFTKNILTYDQVKILKYDNIATNQDFVNIFNINLAMLENIVPSYIKPKKITF